MHDLWHVTAGYGRDALGELSLLAFTYAQEQNRGIGAIALYGYWKVGKELPDFNLRKVIYEGYNNGKKATLWSCEDWESLIKLPLDQVREKLNSKKPLIATVLKGNCVPSSKKIKPLFAMLLRIRDTKECFYISIIRFLKAPCWKAICSYY